MTKHVAVLMGGLSAEREVSLVSGEATCKALLKRGYKVTKIDPSKQLFEQLNTAKADVVFNALHGTYGEDGAIPGMLEVLGIPYTHSGVMASSIALNKDMTKKILQSLGVRVPAGETIEIKALRQLFANNKHPYQQPYVIKPIQQGSSVGVFIIYDEEISQAVSEGIAEGNWRYGEQVMIEQYIPGQEISTAVIQGKAIGSLELRPKTGFYDYTAKYTDGVTEHIYPAKLPEDAYQESLRFASIAHNVLGCRTLSRSDLRYDNTKNILYFLEINTHPGFTPLSIVPDIASHHGIIFEDIVEMLINDATCEIKP